MVVYRTEFGSAEHKTAMIVCIKIPLVHFFSQISDLLVLIVSLFGFTCFFGVSIVNCPAFRSK